MVKGLHFEMKLYFVFLSETRLYEAGYFYAITRKSNLIVNLVQLSERGRHGDSSALVFRAMEEIDNLEVDVILLYTNTPKIEGMLRKVK